MKLCYVKPTALQEIEKCYLTLNSNGVESSVHYTLPKLQQLYLTLKD